MSRQEDNCRMQEIKSTFRSWWSYHRKWGLRWLHAVRPTARENIVGALAGIIAAVVGWHYGYIAHNKLWQGLVLGAAGYGVIFLFYSIGAALVTSSRIDHEQEHEIESLRNDVNSRTEELLAAKQDALDATKKDVQTHNELVTALQEVANQKQIAANNSDAFHAEYAKNSALRQELERFKSNRLKEEWKNLESKFQDVGGGSNSDIEVLWEERKDSGEIRWHLMRGWDEPSRKRFWLVMEEAGHMLLASEYIKSKLPQLMKESDDPAVRWLLVMCSELDEQWVASGSGHTPDFGDYESGVIEDLPRKCGLFCAMLASREKWPKDKEEM